MTWREIRKPSKRGKGRLGTLWKTGVVHSPPCVFLVPTLKGAAIDDIDLLELETGTIWRTDDRGRILNGPQLVIAATRTERSTVAGTAVSDRLADALARAVRTAAAAGDPAEPPPALARCREMLTEQLGPMQLSSGPSYLIPPALDFPPTAPVVSLGEPGLDCVPRPANWEPAEWAELLAGDHGPWAMTVELGRVTSICHCARRTPRAAEAGVWTDPDFRGGGRAATVTAGWARQLAGTGLHLFYSTSKTNRSSQRVAARLGLRPLGWLWQLSRAEPM